MTNTIGQQLKDELTHELSQSEANYDRILYLANEIAKLDDKNIRFSVDASHISRLGIELVSKQETALAELIKNAFDADATTVQVIFRNTATAGGILEITDDGKGMSRDDLLKGFMRISTQDKVHNPVSSKYHRQRAGRKGIGRFAAQRLGHVLHISTQREFDTQSLGLKIDWDQFEGGLDLYRISSQVESLPLKLPGSTLKIRGLRDSWSEAQIQRAYRYISSLLQPFPLDKSAIKQPVETHADPGFKVTIQRENNGILSSVAGEQQSIFPHALAKISGNIDAKGVPHIRIVSSKYKLDVKRQMSGFDLKIKGSPLKDSYLELAGTQFSVHYFIADELPQGTRTMVREILNGHGGVRVYRNGFRVLPYGEPFDDWLGLQRSSALREILPPHHNTNFLGFVEITDVNGTHFEETASREGLLENNAFLELQDLLYRTLMAGVIEIARLRNKKIYASDPPVKKVGEDRGESAKPSAKDIADELRQIANRNDNTLSLDDNSLPSSLPDSKVGHGATQDVFDIKPNDEAAAMSRVAMLADRLDQIAVESDNLLEEIGMLRVLASLGLTIGEFTHEVRHTLAGVNATISLINRQIEDDNPLRPECESLKTDVELLQSYVRYFDDAVTQNAHRKLNSFEIRDLIADFSAMIKPTLKRQGTDLSVNIIGYDLFTKPMHRSEWASIFLNLFTNSLKAIQRSRAKGKIFIEAKANQDFLQIEFSDNGDGISPSNKEKVFDAFFTTNLPSSVMASDSDKLMGTGLGLKIVRDILDGVGGEIDIVPPPDGYSTCFRIEVPMANKDEIEDEYK